MAFSGVAAAATVADVAVLPTPAGAATVGDGYWNTSGGQILDAAGNPEVVHGLWGQGYKTIVGTVKSFGYHTIRIPFSDQMVEGSTINYAGSVGVKVILDNHRSEDGNSAEQNGLWHTAAYPETTWINDWVALANRYKGNSTVVATDPRNEPHGQWFSGIVQYIKANNLSWTYWALKDADDNATIPAGGNLSGAARR